MSNQERAEEIIYGLITGDDHRPRDVARNLARTLSDAGLLAPDLPEPAYFESGEVEWDTLDGYVNINDGLITVSYSETNEHDDAPTVERLTPDPGELKFLDPTAAKDIGTLLIAAANHAEEGKRG